jgi:hypothetical protein
MHAGDLQHVDFIGYAMGTEKHKIAQTALERL